VDQWFTHPDATLVDDVAVLVWAPPAELVDYLVFPLSKAVDESTGHGVGDEVFLPGLFVNHTGTERNIPIVRIGNIAAMPDEPVESKIGPLDAYLVEARSIGGLSGSPVFVNLGLHRIVDGEMKIATGNMFKLLGMMHGHWTVKAPKKDEAAKDDDDEDSARMDDLSDEAINMGIAIVVPIERIKAVINLPQLVAMRDTQDVAAARDVGAALPAQDSAG
jgi:hypothetical protein